MYVLIRQLKEPNLETMQGWKLPHTYCPMSMHARWETAEQRAQELNMVAANYGVLRDFDNGGLKSFSADLQAAAEHLAEIERQHGRSNHASAHLLQTWRVEYIVRSVEVGA